ncbi:MAG: TonB-dependent receptor [Gemmatimonadetes bacterium]|nr:TonB-dependent receptor [Gemmatimonadota bacterium]
MRAPALAALCAVLSAFGAAGPLTAQPPSADSITPISLAPITVTVLRTPFELNLAPYSVAVATRERIRLARPGLALDEALRGVPGVQVDNRFNYALGERISIRGFGARAQFGVRGVRVLLDGIPATMPDGQTTLNHVNPSALGRIEVIRGPASTLYGNAAGGVIQLRSAPPPPVPFLQGIRVLAGGDGLTRLESTSAGTSGRTSYLLSLNRLHYDGYREYGAAENVQASAHLGHEGESSDLSAWLHFVDYDGQNPGSLSDSLLRVDRTRAFPFNVRQQTREEGRHAQIGASWRQRLAHGELELAGYALTRELDNPIPPRIIDLERQAAGVRVVYAADVRTAGRSARLALGAEADGQFDDRRNFVNQSGERGALTLDQEERVRATGMFGQLAGQPGARTELMAGLRYDRASFRVADRLITAANPDDSGERTMHAVSPSLGVLVAVAEPLHLYGNASTSFETPTTTELANRPSGAGGFNPDLEPQRTRSIELGAKGRLGGRAAYHLAFYHARVRDQLIPFEVPDVPGRQFFRNAGSATHRGIELGASVAVASGATAELAYAYTDARFSSYRTAQASFDGKHVPGVAPQRLNLLLALRGSGGAFADVEARYASRMAADDANRSFSPSHVVTDLRAGLRERRIRTLELSPFLGITNLFDVEYNTSVVVNAAGGRYYEPGPGRRFYAGMDARFPAR